MESREKFLCEIIDANTELKVVLKLILVDAEATLCGQRLYFESVGSTHGNEHCVKRLRSILDSRNAYLAGELRGF